MTEGTYCNFCTAHRLERKKMIASPLVDVFICDLCVVLCVGVLVSPENANNVIEHFEEMSTPRDGKQ